MFSATLFNSFMPPNHASWLDILIQTIDMSHDSFLPHILSPAVLFLTFLSQQMNALFLALLFDNCFSLFS
jgi:hypothetical protein